MDELPTPSRTSPSGVSLRGVSPAANRVPDMTRNEAVLQKSLEGILWDEWKDADGLLWCEVKGCIETYLETLPEDELEVINNF